MEVEFIETSEWFLSSILNTVIYTEKILHVKSVLHSWDKSQLVIMYYFYMLLYLTC